MKTPAPRKAVVSYEQAHLRLKTWRGRPDTMSCVECGGMGQEWAYLGGDPAELRNAKGRPYSLDMARYAPMCKVCHRRFDRAAADGRPVTHCPRGHEWTEQNTGIRTRRGKTTGLRFCRACHRENSAAWRAALPPDRLAAVNAANAAYGRAWRRRQRETAAARAVAS